MLAITVLALVPFDAMGATLGEALETLSRSHKRIIAAKAELDRSKEEAKAAWKDWHPNFSVTANIGHEEQNKPTGTTDTNLVPRVLDLSITQKVWDFGATNAAIRIANLNVEKAQLTLDFTRRGIVLDGVKAFFGLLQARDLLTLARKVETYLQEQVDLEESRLKSGSGSKKELLNTKILLFQSTAIKTEDEEKLVRALNQFETVFGYQSDSRDMIKEPRLPLEHLPTSAEDAVEQAVSADEQLAISRIDSLISRENTRVTRASEFFPTIEASAGSIFKEDEGGTVGSQQERIVKLEATYNFSLGLTAINTLRAAKQDYVSKHNTQKDILTATTGFAKTAFSALKTFNDRIDSLEQAAALSQEKIDLITSEVDNNDAEKSDLLTAEKELSDIIRKKITAETTRKIGVYLVLWVINKLDVGILD